MLQLVKTILAVEDSRFLRLAIERTLAKAGYNVETACDGDEALRIAGQSRPDLVLLEVWLPKLPGPKFLRSLRTTPQTASIPIAVLSSLPQSNEQKLKRDGATAYFDKSSLGLHERSDSLVSIVKTMLDPPKENNDEVHEPSTACSNTPERGEL